jgi:hypothetical protein
VLGFVKATECIERYLAYGLGERTLANRVTRLISFRELPERFETKASFRDL